jgi:dUTP pyrophosphatase
VAKKHLQLANSVGIIDEEYRGEMVLIFDKINTSYSDKGVIWAIADGQKYTVGEKFAQLVVRERLDAEWEEVTELGETERGAGGFGSTGK